MFEWQCFQTFERLSLSKKKNPVTKPVNGKHGKLVNTPDGKQRIKIAALRTVFTNVLIDD